MYTYTVFLYTYINAAKPSTNTIYHTNWLFCRQSSHVHTRTQYLSCGQRLSTGCVIGWRATKVSKRYDTIRNSERRDTGLEACYVHLLILAQLQKYHENLFYLLKIIKIWLFVFIYNNSAKC